VNLVRITTTRSSVCSRPYGSLLSRSISTAVGDRRHLLRSLTARIFLVLPVADVSLAFADLGGREEAFDEWVSSTPFFLSRFPVMRRGKPRMLSALSKDGPEHQFFNTCNTFGNWKFYARHEDGAA